MFLSAFLLLLYKGVIRTMKRRKRLFVVSEVQSIHVNSLSSGKGFHLKQVISRYDLVF